MILYSDIYVDTALYYSIFMCYFAGGDAHKNGIVLLRVNIYELNFLSLQTEKRTIMQLRDKKAFLFDFDGVIVGTESSYSIFWNGIGNTYLSDPEFGPKIKGQSLTYILNQHFPQEIIPEIIRKVDDFEASMPFTPIPGAFEFLEFLKANGRYTAIVTSSNKRKMGNVYRVYPFIKSLVCNIITSEDFTKSKPDPECFLLGMHKGDATAEESVVFEDSFYGLKAARASQATVVALATTHNQEKLQDKADIIIPDFLEIETLW